MLNNIYTKSDITNYYRNNLGNSRRDKIKTSLNSKSSSRQRNTTSNLNINDVSNKLYKKKREISLNSFENNNSLSSKKSIFKHSNILSTDLSKYSYNSNSKGSSKVLYQSNEFKKIINNNYTNRKATHLSSSTNLKRIINAKEKEMEKIFEYNKIVKTQFDGPPIKKKKINDISNYNKIKNPNTTRKITSNILSRNNHELIYKKKLIPNSAKETKETLTTTEEEQKDFKDESIKSEIFFSNRFKTRIIKNNNKYVNKENKRTIKKPINHFKKIQIEKEAKKKLEINVIIIQRFWKKWFNNVYLNKIIKIQSFYKSYSIRKKMLILIQKINLIQSFLKTKFLKQKIVNLRKNSVIIQKNFKRYLKKKNINKLRQSIIKIQKVYKSFIKRKKFKDLRKKIIKIQKAYKTMIIKKKITDYNLVYKLIAIMHGFLIRKKMKTLKNSVLFIQKLFKGFKERKKINKLRNNVIQIQKIFKGILQRKKSLNLKNKVKLIQKISKGYLDKKRMINLRKKVLLVQKSYRRFIYRKKFIDFKNKTIIIQKILKGYNIKKTLKLLKNKVIIIQKIIKVIYKRKQISILKQKVIKIQSIIRCILSKLKIKKLKTTLSNLIKKLEIKIKKKGFKFLISQFLRKITSLNFNKQNKEGIDEGYKRLIRILNEYGSGIRNFPRPYCEIGTNLKILKRIIDKTNNSNDDDLFLFKAFDMKYSGITSQLILNVSEKKNKLNKIVNQNKNNNNNIMKKFQDENIEENKENENKKIEEAKILAEDVYETKSFLKSKNITSKIEKINMKNFLYNKWNYFIKKKFIQNYIDEMKKIIKIQRNIKLFLMRKQIIYQLNKSTKFLTKVKFFEIILREAITNNVRKTTLIHFHKIIPLLKKKRITVKEEKKIIPLSPKSQKIVFTPIIKRKKSKFDKELIINNINKKVINKNKDKDKENEMCTKYRNSITFKKRTNLIIPIITNKEEKTIKRESTLKKKNKKKILIHTKIVDEPEINNNCKTEQNNNSNLFYNQNDEFITLRSGIDNELEESKNLNSQKITEKSFESSGSIIINDREIYVNTNNIIPININDPKKKMKSAFFNIIVNNIKK